jgi:hypothetical protein
MRVDRGSLRILFKSTIREYVILERTENERRKKKA